VPKIDCAKGIFLDDKGNPVVYCEFSLARDPKTHQNSPIHLNCNMVGRSRFEEGRNNYWINNPEWVEEIPTGWVNHVVCMTRCQKHPQLPCPHRRYENPRVSDLILANEEALFRNPNYIVKLLMEEKISKG
jgi:hypothetical protein